MFCTSGMMFLFSKASLRCLMAENCGQDLGARKQANAFLGDVTLTGRALARD